MEERAAKVRAVSLGKLLPGAEFLGADDVRVSSCSADSRSCRPGDLFVALVGTARDGHDFVRDASRRGAVAVLAERPVAGCRLPVCCVEDTRQAYGLVCQALAGHPSRGLKVVGITGTNGKTTTSYLVAGVLSAAGYRPGILGTIGYWDGSEVARADWTTPPPPVLATWLLRMAANGCSHAVMEVSSHALVQRRIAGIDLDVACVTNVRQDHLDYHGTVVNYRAAKAKLFRHLVPEGFSVINADDAVSAGWLERIEGPALSVGVRSPAEVTATVVEMGPSEQTFLVSVGSETAPVRTVLIGAHHIYNCLVAVAVGLVYGIDLATIVRGLEAVQTIPGRLERLECGQPFSVFVDYAHTPDALAGCLATLRSVTRGRLICVFGAGGNRDKSKRPRMGRAVESRADVAVVTNDNPRTEPPHEIIAGIVHGFRNPAAVRVIPDRAQAIRWALGQAGERDSVLIAGKGHEDYQIIGRQRHEFDDREVARAWLYEAAAADKLYRASA